MNDEALNFARRMAEFGKRTVPNIPTETTPKKLTPKITALCEHLAPGKQPATIPVRPEPTAIYGECYINVQNAIATRGGSCQTGWIIWQQPGILLNAERHACWVSPKGDLVDITPKLHDETEVLFLTDNEPWNGNRATARTAIVCLRPDVPEIREHVEMTQKNMQRQAFGSELPPEIVAATTNRLNDYLGAEKKKQLKGDRKARRRQS